MPFYRSHTCEKSTARAAIKLSWVVVSARSCLQLLQPGPSTSFTTLILTFYSHLWMISSYFFMGMKKELESEDRGWGCLLFASCLLCAFHIHQRAYRVGGVQVRACLRHCGLFELTLLLSRIPSTRVEPRWDFLARTLICQGLPPWWRTDVSSCLPPFFVRPCDMSICHRGPSAVDRVFIYNSLQVVSMSVDRGGFTQ